MNECCFCKEYHNAHSSAFYCLLGKKKGFHSRVLAESTNWYAIPTLGSLTVGYVLLVCKHHYLSLATMNRDLIFEMIELKENIEKIILSKMNLHCVTFEHGSTTGEVGANSVDHVHVHIVPLQENVWNDISKRNSIVDFCKIADYSSLIDLWENELPDSYLLFQDLDKNIYYIKDAKKYDSQFFRKCISSYLNVEVWDWRQEIFPDNLIKTLKLLGITSSAS